MKALHLCQATGILLATLTSPSSATAVNNETWPIRDTETGDKTVQWDHYSLIFNGERIFSFSGEFHPFRIPVPEIWMDILEKIKAAGMNTMSFYDHWGYHSSWPDQVDFSSGALDLARLYEMCKEVGLFVSSRPGPYINAELNAGGLALWATTGKYGGLRDNSTEWTGAWKPYMDAFDEITTKYQITQDGTVLLYQIENEFPDQWTDVEEKIPDPVPIAYMETLFENVQENGIVVPITHNMPGQAYKSWSVDYDTVGAGGNVHIYGLDNYPSCWSCIMDDCSTSNPSFTLMDYVAHFEEVSPKQPSMMPEFQGGATNPWYGPPEGCLNKTDDRFVSLYYRDNIAQRVTILNLYMMYGGTNWGSIGAPFQTSSYDYSAAISENRTIGTKYYEMKNLALFTRVAKDLTKTDLVVGNSTVYSDNEGITTIELRNPDTDAGFYAVRHTDPKSPNTESFQLSVKTSAGNVTIPQEGGKIHLQGHYAKILITDFKFGPANLVYSSAEILTYALFDSEPTLVLWVFEGEGGEFMLSDADNARVISGDGSKVKVSEARGGLLVNFSDQTGKTVVEFDNGVRVLILDRAAAHAFWVPALTNDPMVPVDKAAFVQGPYLVRGAEVDGHVLSLRGDSNKKTEIEVYAHKAVREVRWNGKEIKVTRTPSGSLKGDIEGPVDFPAPAMGQWKVRDSLPEGWANYSDAGQAWVNADHEETSNPHDEGTKPYLYSDDYNFHNGIHLWRGRFRGSASGMFLQTQGGITHGWSVYLNGKFIGSYEGSLDSGRGEDDLEFPEDAVNTEDDNIVLVVQDNAGHEQGRASLEPRGIINATLFDNDEGFTSWKVAGTAGRGQGIDIDPVRTHYSQGGLTAERLGWHLPGYDDTAWEDGSPSDGLDEPGIKFYRSVVHLDTPEGHDVSLSVRFGYNQDTPSSFRAYLYVNGYQYGKYFPRFIAERDTFPVPPGIWNYNGDNVLGIVLWNQGEDPISVDVDIVVNYVIASSLDVKFDSGYLQPPWSEERSKYA